MFRDCLRWEFGFTCAVCLLHERHFVLPGTGVDGTGQWTVEHIVLKSTPEGKPLENIYTNCLFMCRLCNTTRGNRHSHQKVDGTRLLNPIDDVWAEHFQVNGERLDPLEGDKDASYTETAYGINDYEHVARRRAMGQLLRDSMSALRMAMAEVAHKDAELLRPNVSVDRKAELQVSRGRWAAEVRRWRIALEQYSGIPQDAPETCRCESTALSVPAEVDDGWQTVPDLPAPPGPLPAKRRFRD